MPRYRRKAGSTYGGAYRRRMRAHRRRIRPAQRGYVRTAGYFGKYAGGTPSELKFHDVPLDDAVVATLGTVFASLLTIPEGNGEEERIGRKIVIKKIQWRYSLELPESTLGGSTSDLVRVMLVLDQQCNGAAPTVDDMLKEGTGITYQNFNDLANSRRFKVLLDKTHSISAPAGSGQGTTGTLDYGMKQQSYTFFKSCNIRIEYDSTATTGVIGTIRSNNLFCLFISKKGKAGLTSRFRFRFND